MVWQTITGKVLASRESNQNFNLLMQNILWENGEAVIFVRI
jgi:hypothetical protein